jgi:DNA-binding NtrC family response regulator
MATTVMAVEPLYILSLEDSRQDFEIISQLLLDTAYEVHMDLAVNETEYIAALHKRKYDIILADFKLPGFDAFGALRLCNEICPGTPLICVSGSIGEEIAIELMKNGAVDYVLKDRMIRLPLAIERARDEVRHRETQRQAERTLKEHMDELQRFQRLSVGRELTMIALKKEVNELLVQSGRKEKYRIVV